MPIFYACPQCQSTDVLTDASAHWDTELQSWQISSVQDYMTCGACGYENDSGKGFERTVPAHMTYWESLIARAPEGVSTQQTEGLQSAVVIKWRAYGHCLFPSNDLNLALGKEMLERVQS